MRGARREVSCLVEVVYIGLQRGVVNIELYWQRETIGKYDLSIIRRFDRVAKYQKIMQHFNFDVQTIMHFNNPTYRNYNWSQNYPILHDI